MEISSQVRRSADTRADADSIYALLADVGRSVSHFPDLESVVERGGAWYWTFHKLGAGPFTFQVSYANRYFMDAAARRVWWEAVPGFGNTRIDGQWIIEPHRFTMEARFALQTPFPRISRAPVEAIVQHENERLINAYLHNLVTTLHGGDGRVRR